MYSINIKDLTSSLSCRNWERAETGSVVDRGNFWFSNANCWKEYLV